MQVLQLRSAVTSVFRRTADIFILSIHSPAISSIVRPGQFINIKVNDFTVPLLRRPFSAYRVNGENVEIIFNVVGLGTNILSQKRPGDFADVLGPLGNSFGIDASFSTAVLVGGGLGVAPFPILTEWLRRSGKNIVTFLGARTKDHLVTDHLQHVQTATDDGSAGFHGTVLRCLEETFRDKPFDRPKIFACGPNILLHHLSRFAQSAGIPCELSLESVMACGVGICQGCPVESTNENRRYALVCKDGPVFDCRNIGELHR